VTGIAAAQSKPSFAEIRVLSRKRSASSRALVLAAAALLASLAARDAAAQGEIRSVRIGRYAGHDRLVFELGALPVDVYESDGNEFQIEFRAAPPPLNRQTQARLSAMGIRIAPTQEGTSVAIERRGRSLLAFRLPSISAQAGGPSERIVIDVGRSGASLVPPRDGQLLRLGRTAPEQAQTADDFEPPDLPPVATAPRAAPARAAAPPPPPPAPVEPDSARLSGFTAAVAPPPRAAEPPASTPAPRVEEKVWVRFRDLLFAGLGAGPPTREDLLEIELSVSVAANGDLVAERPELPLQTMKLRDVLGSAGGGSRIGGSLLQQIVERVAGAYAEAGKLEARIDIREVDLARVANRRDGVLTINIVESPRP
jgi:hypothetical protein